MRCPSCQVDNPPENWFCEQCGAPLAARCTQCGAPVGLGVRFCGACGHRLMRPGAGAPAHASQLGVVAALLTADTLRLVYEFTRSHRTLRWLLLESSSVSYGKATPYLPVIDLLKAYFGIEDRDDARRTHEKVIGKLLILDEALRPTAPAFLFYIMGAYDQALAMSEALGMRPLQAHCHLGLGTLYAKVGRQEQTRVELATAIKLYRSMEMTCWLTQAEATLAGMVAPAGVADPVTGVKPRRRSRKKRMS